MQRTPALLKSVSSSSIRSSFDHAASFPTNPSEENGEDNIEAEPVSMNPITHMMRVLLTESEERQKKSMEDVMRTSITEQIELLREELEVEREERIRSTQELQNQINALQKKWKDYQHVRPKLLKVDVMK